MSLLATPRRPAGLPLVRLLPCIAALAFATSVHAAPEWPALPEVISQIRAVLPDLQPPSAGITNVESFLKEISPRVLPDTDSDPASTPPPLLKTTVYDAGAGGGSAAYLRPGRVDAGLQPALEAALDGMLRTNTLAGIILDLRRAQGFDHPSAIAAAKSLLHRPVNGVRIEDRELAAEPVAGRKPLPLMILVGQETRGAAEVLAAVLRRGASPSLLIGSTTAGQGRVYRTLALSTGHRLRVSGAPVLLPGGDPLPGSGLVPDLSVAIDPRDEQAYLDNEFVRSSNGQPATITSSFRLNEAELVRRRSGSHPASPSAPDAAAPGRRPARVRPDGAAQVEPSAAPAVHDPVLARALDLLSGLATSTLSPGEGDSR